MRRSDIIDDKQLKWLPIEEYLRLSVYFLALIIIDRRQSCSLYGFPHVNLFGHNFLLGKNVSKENIQLLCSIIKLT